MYTITGSFYAVFALSVGVDFTGSYYRTTQCCLIVLPCCLFAVLGLQIVTVILWANK